MSTLFVTSTSTEQESHLAVSKQLKRPLQNCTSNSPAWYSILLCEHNYQAVIEGIKEVVGEVPLVGCSSAGAFTEVRSLKNGIALALIASVPISSLPAWVYT